MILADTSAWVEFDRGAQSPAGYRMRELVSSEGPLATTQPVVMELLAGVRDDRRHAQLRRLLQRFRLLPFDAGTDFDAAALVYRRCRQAGITPRGMIDCMVAAVAWRHEATLLAHDVDLFRVASVIGIGLDEASLRT